MRFVCLRTFFTLGCALHGFFFRLLQNIQIKTKWQRTRTIMALIPPENAPSSDSSSSSEDEVLIQNPIQHNDDDDITYCSSEPRSYPSSLNDLNIFSSDNVDPPPLPAACNPVLSDEETIPLSPVINSMFPTSQQQEHLPLLNSVSSILSPVISNSAAATTTRSKRKAVNTPKVVTKRVKKFIKKPLNYKWKTGKLKHTTKIELTHYNPPFDASFKSPFDYFQTFFSEDVLDIITDNTNLLVTTLF